MTSNHEKFKYVFDILLVRDATVEQSLQKLFSAIVDSEMIACMHWKLEVNSSIVLSCNASRSVIARQQFLVSNGLC